MLCFRITFVQCLPHGLHCPKCCTFTNLCIPGNISRGRHYHYPMLQSKKLSHINLPKGIKLGSCRAITWTQQFWQPEFRSHVLFTTTPGSSSWRLKVVLDDSLIIRRKIGFPCGSAGKESACSVRDLGSIPGLRESPGEEKGYPLQYSALENSMDCIVYGVAKSNTTERLSLHRRKIKESSLIVYNSNPVLWPKFTPSNTPTILQFKKLLEN